MSNIFKARLRDQTLWYFVVSCFRLSPNHSIRSTPFAMEGIHGEEAEKQYHSVAVFTLGVENASKRLRQHVLGKKLMSEDELKESLQEMEEMMQACRIHTVHNFVSLDSDAIERIDEEVNKLIRETYGEVSDEEESDGEKTSSPPASLKSKKKGTSKGKGKGKSSTSTSNGQVSGAIS